MFEACASLGLCIVFARDVQGDYLLGVKEPAFTPRRTRDTASLGRPETRRAQRGLVPEHRVVVAPTLTAMTLYLFSTCIHTQGTHDIL